MNSGGQDDTLRQLEDQEILQNQAELEAKKEELFKTRLDIVKSHGALSFTPDKSILNSKNISSSFGKDSSSPGFKPTAELNKYFANNFTSKKG